jgi:iron complex outermembrane recepter protein
MKKHIITLILGFSAMAIAQTNDTIKITEKQTFKLDEVVISSSFNKLQSQNVMKIEHQKVKDLLKKGATTLVEGLTNIPGVSQLSTGVSIGKPIIRGLGGNRIAIYTQGIRLENQQFGDEHGLGIHDAGIESVEVIKGPASLLYGSDAMAGVLYFNPEKFAESNTFAVNFAHQYLTNTFGQKTNLGVKFSQNKWKFLVRGAYDTNADYKIPNNEQVENSRFNENDFKAAIGFEDRKISSTIRYNLNKLDIGLPTHGLDTETHRQISTSKSPEFPKQAVSNHIISVNNIFSFEKSKLETNFGYIFNDRKEFEDSEKPELHMKLSTINYDIKYFLPKTERLETIFGISGMQQKNSNFGEKYLIPNAITSDFGFFATSNYTKNKNDFQIGLRYDNRQIETQKHLEESEAGYMKAISKNFASFNVMAGYKYNLQNNFILRLNLATGFRAPNLSEMSSNGVHEGTNRYEIGNENLIPEQNFQTDINLEYKNSHFEFFVNGFNNIVNNYGSTTN